MNENLNRALTGIVIDPGNGGADKGAVGNGITEKDLNLEISKYMYDRLKELGVPVTLTRTTDVDLDATTRTNKIKNAYGTGKDVVVISNHMNTGGNNGAEIIYALRNTDTLSNKILNNLVQEGQTVLKSYQRRLPSNPAQDYYAVIRDTPNTESLIINYGFVDNAEDANKLKNNYKDYAEGVIRALAEYKGFKYAPPKGSKEYYTVVSGDTIFMGNNEY